MKSFIYLTLIFALALTSCTGDYKKGDNGLEYKIISGDGGKKLAYGNFIQMDIAQSYKGDKKDTMLGDSRDYMPRIESYDSMTTPPAYLKLLKEVKKGDSVVIRLLVDSAYKNSTQPLPPFMKRGGYIYTTVKIINIFETKEQKDSANKAELKLNGAKIFKKQTARVVKDLEANKAQIEMDSKIISGYLEKNNIRAIKGSWGTFVDIHTEGTGDQIGSNSVVMVNYTGKTLDSGKVFDSNIDPQFKHTEPLEVPIGQVGTVILGWTDALLQMKKGTKATVYIPSSLGYGKNGNSPKIKPDANLVFEIEVINVISEEEAMAIAEGKRKLQEETSKKMMDSLKKVAPTEPKK